MKRSTHWLVADEGIRPTGPPDRCFYCDRPQGREHAEGCVIRSRTVVVRFHVDLVVEVPEDWSEAMVNSQFNESSWCANNLVDELAESVERANQMGDCLCSSVRAEFVREATADDEEAWGLRVDEVPS